MHIYIRQAEWVINRTPGYYAEVRRFTSDVEEIEANARLIAAAPELLEALEDVMRLVEVLTPLEGAECRKGHRAIAKAKGEQ